MAAFLDVDGQPMRRVAAASAYAGASSHRGADRLSQELAGWDPPLQSPDAGLLPERDDLVARWRDLGRNNGFAAGLRQNQVDNVVGPGWQLSCIPDWVALGLFDSMTDAERDAFENQVEALWRSVANDPGKWLDAARRCTFDDLLRLQFLTWFDTGEMLSVAQWLPERIAPGRARYATAIRVVDPDRLSNPQGAPETDRLRGGIELGEHTEPLAYHIRRSHPGDRWFAGDQWTWTRIERETSWGRPIVMHSFLVDADGQTRAAPPAASIIEALRLQDVYERSEAKAAIVNAMFAAALETEFPQDPDLMAAILGVTADDKGYRYLPEGPMRLPASNPLRLAGNVIPQLPVGASLKFQTATRPAAPAFAQFEESVLRRIAAGGRTSYEQLARDYSKTNYSSARAALLEAYKGLTSSSAFLGRGFASPCYGLVFEEAVDRGDIELPRGAPAFHEARAAWTRCAWIGPGRGQIDEVKEAQAAQVRMDTFVSDLRTEAAALGRDWREVAEQRAREARRLSALGLNAADTGSLLRVRAPTDAPGREEAA